jgi:hypothetical protein
MTMKKTIKIFVFGLLSAALFSCQDAALPTIDNMAYISDAANGRLGVVSMAETGHDTQVNFTVRLAQVADEDTKVKVSIDTTVLQNYNSTYQTGFKHVAAENIEAPYYVNIPAGSITSDPVAIIVKSFDIREGNRKKRGNAFCNIVIAFNEYYVFNSCVRADGAIGVITYNQSFIIIGKLIKNVFVRASDL